ncbi:MAG: hypothetical protein J5993_03765 [Clostridia bacterium]|nr:hypothetical protein [Clostridia bacterium]
MKKIKQFFWVIMCALLAVCSLFGCQLNERQDNPYERLIRNENTTVVLYYGSVIYSSNATKMTEKEYATYEKKLLRILRSKHLTFEESELDRQTIFSMAVDEGFFLRVSCEGIKMSFYVLADGTVYYSCRRGDFYPDGMEYPPEEIVVYRSTKQLNFKKLSGYGLRDGIWVTNDV